MTISIFMMLPLLLFGSWLYFRFTPGPRRGTSLAFDALVFAVAIGASFFLSWLALAYAPDNAGPIWRPVLLTLTIYHVFALVLPVAAWLKRKRFSPQAETATANNGSRFDD